MVRLVTGIFGLDPARPGLTYKKVTNGNGGKAYYIQNIDETVNGTDRLTWVLDDALPVWDVKIDGALSTDGAFAYTHKVLDGADYYFFANSSSTAINTRVRLRGRLTPRTMNPHTGVISDAQFQNTIESGQDVTLVTLRVDPVRSMFIAGSRADVPVLAPRAENRLPTRSDLRAQGSGLAVQIRFAVPLDAFKVPVTLRLYDVRGRLVSALTDGKTFAAGYHAVSFDARRLSGGQYLCRMTAGGFEKSVVVSLVR